MRYPSPLGRSAGACRRYPPSIPAADSRGSVVSPSTSEYEWCGEWQERYGADDAPPARVVADPEWLVDLEP